ncbi:formylglycine-generating enzyme family protein [Desulfosarcina ovata]|uniref:Sulfatase-modifying factor enzyme-like domain-containing protein n=1 Tax=Desulfosarcina ovata subsp. ovata TaxID=2752305 RepID=A0A5K8ACE2_9BACT|nr:formylglycine-generating enzyme family protein [Desulfosarcina ovata]BBO90211.1 hypothetical protein DSCOOX_33910 [Desulfosarcina ovata subsp. ovata]
MRQLLFCMTIMFFITLSSYTAVARSSTQEKDDSEQPQAGEVWIEPWTGMAFVWVPGGCFQMGTPKGGSFNTVRVQEAEALDGNFFVSIFKIASIFFPVGCSSMRTSIPADFDKYTMDERPVHKVCLNGFWIGKHEVTQEQWIKVLGNNPSYFKLGNDYPVEQVSWDDAFQFINSLNNKTDVAFSLPTEAQWEYAARSGGKKEIYSGSDNASEVAWYFENSENKTHKVGTKLANGLGIHDMSGNLREWCKDMYAKDAYNNHSLNNPMYVTEDKKRKFSRTIRGGSYYLNSCDVRCTSRTWSWRDHNEVDVGFRLIRKN